MYTRDQSIITVVSGLPRSGTSLMMSMLAAGGLPPLTDDIRQADDDNPKGYYEFERVKQLKQDVSWLPSAQGKAVKIISSLLMKLPAGYHYKIIFMRRNMQEILASQRQMLIRRGQPDDKVSDVEMAALFERHLQQIELWLDQQNSMSVLYVDYARLVQSPIEQVTTINTFLGGWLDER
ncbi:MAG: sulfotransferase, partial [Chloroflexi bacterium]|nr:sulfotransferase [Chloroflexota bacterium]